MTVDICNSSTLIVEFEFQDFARSHAEECVMKLRKLDMPIRVIFYPRSLSHDRVGNTNLIMLLKREGLYKSITEIHPDYSD